MKNNTELNRDDVIRSIALATGFTQKDIRSVLEAQELVYVKAIEQGYSIKNKKLYRLEVEEKKGFTGYDGLNQTYYEAQPKKILKFKPLSALTKALDELNKS